MFLNQSVLIRTMSLVLKWAFSDFQAWIVATLRMAHNSSFLNNNNDTNTSITNTRNKVIALVYPAHLVNAGLEKTVDF